jgi:hypothetical protein
MAESQRDERRRILKDDANTLAAMHRVLDPTPGGRFAKVKGEYTIGSGPIVQYPRQPPNSPWAEEPAGLEPPLGYSVDDLAPVGSPIPDGTADPSSATAAASPGGGSVFSSFRRDIA